jgi:hypothetical protein
MGFVLIARAVAAGQIWTWQGWSSAARALGAYSGCEYDAGCVT